VAEVRSGVFWLWHTRRPTITRLLPCR